MHLPYLNPHCEPRKKVRDGCKFNRNSADKERKFVQNKHPDFGKVSQNKQQKGNEDEDYTVTT